MDIGHIVPAAPVEVDRAGADIASEDPDCIVGTD